MLVMITNELALVPEAVRSVSYEKSDGLITIRCIEGVNDWTLSGRSQQFFNRIVKNINNAVEKGSEE